MLHNFKSLCSIKFNLSVYYIFKKEIINSLFFVTIIIIIIIIICILNLLLIKLNI